MGASTFITTSEQNDPQVAFSELVQQAKFEYGFGGYSGSIGEKDSFLVASHSSRSLDDAVALADRLLDDDRFSDKWGPAGALPLQDGGWLFFGWASE